jgi:hypothetical protein
MVIVVDEDTSVEKTVGAIGRADVEHPVSAFSNITFSNEQRRAFHPIERVDAKEERASAVMELGAGCEFSAAKFVAVGAEGAGGGGEEKTC